MKKFFFWSTPAICRNNVFFVVVDRIFDNLFIQLRIIIADDNYTLEYINRAVLSNSLISYGISSDHVKNLEVARAERQEHCPRATAAIASNKTGYYSNM